MRKKIFMVLGCFMELAGAVVVTYTRFSHPALTETQLLINCWPSFGLAILLILAGLDFTSIWRR